MGTGISYSPQPHTGKRIQELISGPFFRSTCLCFQPTLAPDRGEWLDEAVFPKPPENAPEDFPTYTEDEQPESAGAGADETQEEPTPEGKGIPARTRTPQRDAQRIRDDPQVVLATVEDKFRAWSRAGEIER